MNYFCTPLKRIISITLLIALLLQTNSQLWILLSFQLNKSYIAANICINRFDAIPVCKGSCVLQKSIDADEEQKQKLPELKLKEGTFFYKTDITYLRDKQVARASISYSATLSISFIPQAYPASIFHPPSPVV